MIVLDTDVISNLMRPQPLASLAARLAEMPIAEQCTTAISMGELAYGAYRVGRGDLYQRALKLLIGVRILPFNREVAERYGQLRSQLEREGQRLAAPDLRIAATVLGYEATLVTGNVRHFARVADLRVENWLSN